MVVTRNWHKLTKKASELGAVREFKEFRVIFFFWRQNVDCLLGVPKSSYGAATADKE